jgi:putative hydrolase of the HAD superfamily
VVHDTTGSDDAFDDLYAHYRGAAAWRVADGASACLATLREAGLRIGLVSNWDDRLRHSLAELDLLRHFDAVIVSAEGPDEKPAASFFARALAALHVTPARWLHVGDDHHDDIAGARAIGGHALHIAHDIAGFDALRAMLTSAVRT